MGLQIKMAMASFVFNVLSFAIYLLINKCSKWSWKLEIKVTKGINDWRICFMMLLSVEDYGSAVSLSKPPLWFVCVLQPPLSVSISLPVCLFRAMFAKRPGFLSPKDAMQIQAHSHTYLHISFSCKGIYSVSLSGFTHTPAHHPVTSLCWCDRQPYCVCLCACVHPS